jgi:RNA 3'-terminal phosphate cyclase (ATP)
VSELNVIEVDGSVGEGGGQVLRTALAVAAVLERPVRVYNIRVKRQRPGLQRQHMTSVKAMAEISRGKVEGLSLGSTEVTFYPGRPTGGSYFFDIGTAGSVTLLLQTIMPVMAAAGEATARVRGGTDVPKAPPIDYYRFVLAPLLAKFNISLDIRLLRRGHYPRGGGEVVVTLRKEGPLRPVSLVSSGKVIRVEGLSHCVRLPAHVAQRQASAAAELLKRLGSPVNIMTESYESAKDPHLGPGSGILVWAVTESSVLGGDALGERGKPAEEVGREAARSLLEDLSTGMALDRHASDMLLIYTALAGGTSELGGASLTLHARTVIDVLRTMLPEASISLSGDLNRPFTARIKGASLL